MRGLVAVSVIIWHTMLILIEPISTLIRIAPINIFYAGNEGVIFFFILSGFVMSLPFFKKDIEYSEFLIKRFFRIYIPYLLMILFTFLLYFLFKDIQINGLTGWYYRKWDTPLDVKTFLEYIGSIGIYPTSYNPVIWSLIHEMRISIIFPIIMIMIKKYNWKKSLSIGFMLYLVGQLNEWFHIQESHGAHLSLFDTSHYMYFFIIGALMAKHKDELINAVKKYSVTKKVVLTVIAFLFYLYSRFYAWIVRVLFGTDSILMDFSYSIIDLGVCIGASMLIILVLSSKKIQNRLSNPILVLTGNLSYSLYMLHIPILLVVFRLLYGKISLIIVIFVAYALIFSLSYLTYKYIEIPSMKIGKNLATKRAKSLQSKTV